MQSDARLLRTTGSLSMARPATRIGSWQLLRPEVLLAVALCGLFLLTPSHRYDPDVMPELLAIKHLDAAQPDPAHMLYVRLGVAVYSLWNSLGYVGDPLRPMQVANALFGAGTILIFSSVLRSFVSRRSTILLISAAAALSFTFWTHTADAFFIIPASFFSMLALLAALKAAGATSLGRRAGCGALLGAALGVSVLFYQANAALAPALLVAAWPRTQRPAREWLQTWFVAGLMMLLVAGGGWVYQGITSADVRSPVDLVNWLLLSHGGMKNALWRREAVNLLTTVPKAWIASVVPLYRGLNLRELVQARLSFDHSVAQLGLAVLGAAIVFGAAFALSSPSRLWGAFRQQRAWLIFGLWFAVPGLAVVWFDPAETKLWLIPLFGIWALFAILLANAVSAPARWVRLSAGLLGVAFATVVPVGNLMVAVLPDQRSGSEEMRLAVIAANHMTDRDLLISMTFDWTAYVTYISDHRSVVNGINISQRLGKDSVKAPLMEQMGQVWARGGHIYMPDYFGPGQEQNWSDWITPYTHLTVADFSAFPRRLAWQSEDTSVLELLPPSGTAADIAAL